MNVSSPPVIAQAEYRIVPARLWDLGTLTRLERVMFLRDSYTRLEMLFLLLWPGLHNLKVVSPEGEIVGFASAGRLPLGYKVWIMTIGIHPDHRRRGLGRQLLAAAEAAADSPSIYLTVRLGNQGALALYRQMGYRQVRVKSRYYPDGEDGLEMRKERDPITVLA